MLDVAASLASVRVAIARQDVRRPKRAPQHQFQLHSMRHQSAVPAGEDELCLRRRPSRARTR